MDYFYTLNLMIYPLEAYVNISLFSGYPGFSQPSEAVSQYTPFLVRNNYF